LFDRLSKHQTRVAVRVAPVRGFYRSRRRKRKRFLHPIPFFFTDPARLFIKYHAAPGGYLLAIIFIIKAWQQLVIIADIILNNAGAIGIFIDLIIIEINIIIIFANDNTLG
jgi:hypothetical protein